MPKVPRSLKSIIKILLSEFAIYKLKIMQLRLEALKIKWKARHVKRIFDEAPKTPFWLESDSLELLQHRYPGKTDTYLYDAESVKQRGEERAKIILQLDKMLLRKKVKERTFLELGCGDGMTLFFLKRDDNRVIGIDQKGQEFDQRAVSKGVDFFAMDAHNLELDENSVDFLFSFNSFEHFENPGKALDEMARVTKRGGFIYLSFGPLYMAPNGLHAYKSITFPYCQHLFPREMLESFLDRKGLRSINHVYVNGWSLDDYRKLWRQQSTSLKKIFYHEFYTNYGIELIKEFPSCFKSKTDNFDDLIATRIDVLFEKR